MTRAQEILTIEEQQKKIADPKIIRSKIARKIILLRDEVREIANKLLNILVLIKKTEEDDFRKPRASRGGYLGHVFSQIDEAIEMCRRNFILERPVYQPLARLLVQLAEGLEIYRTHLLGGAMDTKQAALAQFQLMLKDFNSNIGLVMEKLTGTSL